MKRRTPRRRSRRGFTLMELMLVLVILAMLVSVAAPAYNQFHRKGLVKNTQIQLAAFKDAVQGYKFDMNTFPDDLSLLRQAPSDTMAQYWDGPYLNKDVPLDPWANEYQCEVGSDGESCRIWSFGPDKQDGTDDDLSVSIGQ